MSVLTWQLPFVGHLLCNLLLIYYFPLREEDKFGRIELPNNLNGYPHSFLGYEIPIYFERV
ncbi:MAG: hypothetical protein ISS47_01740 [Candidatus Omnitrophica bacterium]|nr:hypothetical protein [Candidatus Omnitrophota bacterium]